MKTTIVIPVYNEGDNICSTLTGILHDVRGDYSVAVVYDREDDTTLPALDKWENEHGINVIRIRNQYGSGALNAIRTGMEKAESEYVIVTMADLSDPPSVMNDMIKTADLEKADIVCASRYMRGGRQIGGPLLKGLMSRFAGLSLHALVDLPTHDPTNSFKLYRKSFLNQMTIESNGGFELGLELVVKAWKQGYKVVEVPTVWRDRLNGKSNFKLWKWLPHYLHWYFTAVEFAFQRNLRNRWRSILSWTIILLAAGWNFYQVFQLSVDVPSGDDWNYLSSVENFSWHSVFSIHMQHRIIFTRILFYLSWLLDDLNIRHLIIFNWFIYLAFVLATMKLFRRNFREFEWFPLFFLPFFSDFAYQNLFWAGQSQYHFMFLFGMLALHFGFQTSRSYRNVVLFSVFLILSMFSMSPLLAAVLFFTWGIRQGWSFLHESGQLRLFTIRSTLLAAVMVGCGILLFFSSHVPSLIDMSRFSFVEFIRHVYVSLPQCYNCIPVHKLHYCPSWIRWVWYSLMAVSFVWFLGICFRLKMRLIEENGSAAAILLWTFSFVVIIAFVRQFSLCERHLEAILPAIPAFASCFAMIRDARIRKIALTHYLVGLLISMSFAFSYDQARKESEAKKRGVELLIQWTQNPNTELYIPALYPNSFSKEGKTAQKLKISCMKQ